MRIAAFLTYIVKNIGMSKDRQTIKEKKKEPSTTGKKAPSDYQSGKSAAVKPIVERKK
jgi:hypothetical protein